jgi:hypothetical protein
MFCRHFTLLLGKINALTMQEILQCHDTGTLGGLVDFSSLTDTAASYYERLTYIGALTCAFGKVPAIDSAVAFHYTTELKYLIWLLLSFVLAFVHRVLPTSMPALRHGYMASMGIIAMQWVYGSDWIHSLFATLSMYGYMAAGMYVRGRAFTGDKGGVNLKAKAESGRDPSLSWYTDPMHPLFAFVLCLAHLVLCHWYQLQVNPDRNFNFTTSQMWLVIKLTSFSTHFYDDLTGRSKPHLSTGSQQGSGKSPSSSPVPVRLPPLLSFLGYSFCFTNLLAGPAISYAAYQRGIRGPDGVQTKLTSEQEAHVADTAGAASIWSSTQYSLLLLAQGALCLGVHQILAATFTAAELLSPDFGTRFSPAYQLLVYYPGYTMARRMQIYFGWKCLEGASVMAGFGYLGKAQVVEAAVDSGRATRAEGGAQLQLWAWEHSARVAWRRVFPGDWSGVSNSSILQYELLAPGSGTRSLRLWNLTTQQWLEHCIYRRSGGSLLLTYAINALWHGLDPGYYIFAGMLLCGTLVERMAGQSAQAVWAYVSHASGAKRICSRSQDSATQSPGLVGRLLGLRENRAVAGAAAAATWVGTWLATVALVSYAQVYFYSMSFTNCVTIFNNTHRWSNAVAPS